MVTPLSAFSLHTNKNEGSGGSGSELRGERREQKKAFSHKTSPEPSLAGNAVPHMVVAWPEEVEGAGISETDPCLIRGAGRGKRAGATHV